jgi:dihydroxyacetone kinase
MKKFINKPEHAVPEMIEGLVGMHAGWVRLQGQNVVLRADFATARERQVAIISGGGSGHEPAHIGFVGAGMLSAAVAGEVFTSPSADSVLAAIRAVAGKPGVLLIVKNYTGDRLNFGLAAEMARAEGIPVATVYVADDVALADRHDRAARRGIAGTVLVHKIAGAAAAEGQSLPGVAAIAQSAADAIATMGISFSAGVVPAMGKPNFTLGEDEVELGLGIHGEPGFRRMPLASADELVDRLLEPILTAQNLESGDRVVLLINNLGATTTMELAIVARRALAALRERGAIVERVYSGTFVSSLDAAGVSLSLLKVDDPRIRWLDAPTSAPAWPNAAAEAPRPIEHHVDVRAAPRVREVVVPTETGQRMSVAVEAACKALIDAESWLTELDRAVGDGDLGVTLSRGAKAVLQNRSARPINNEADALEEIAITLQQSMGGSSGPLYGVLLLRAANSLRGSATRGAIDWAQAAVEACKAVGEMGGASAGDRTMLDALIPFAETFRADLSAGRNASEALNAAVDAAEGGAQETATMFPKRGRSSYLGERALGHPDPGADAAAIWLRAAASAIHRAK